MSLNKATLIGRLGNDPEVRKTGSGQSVANFNLATNESWTDKSGQKQERTEWHRIVAWGKPAELCAQYLSKGREVYLEGKIQSRKWKDEAGIERTTIEIHMTHFVFIGGGNAPGGGGGAKEKQPAPQSYSAPSKPQGVTGYHHAAAPSGPPPMDDFDLGF